MRPQIPAVFYYEIQGEAAPTIMRKMHFLPAAPPIGSHIILPLTTKFKSAPWEMHLEVVRVEFDFLRLTDGGTTLGIGLQSVLGHEWGDDRNAMLIEIAATLYDGWDFDEFDDYNRALAAEAKQAFHKKFGD